MYYLKDMEGLASDNVDCDDFTASQNQVDLGTGSRWSEKEGEDMTTGYDDRIQFPVSQTINDGPRLCGC